MSVPYPAPTSAAVTAVMRGNRKQDTKPEQRLRSALHARGLRFRKHLLVRLDGLVVRPDVVFPRQRIALFVDGCYWHCCPEHGNTPRANTRYWAPKLARNVERDRRVDRALHGGGWTAVRVWEHEPVEEAATRITALVRG